MRLWSLHPEYLDAKGLVAVWREALLARKVLEGQTRGYRHHPQLVRFSAQPDPLAAIECYLQVILEEATRRGYHIDAGKVKMDVRCLNMEVTNGQLSHEMNHLLMKLKLRDPSGYKKLRDVRELRAHPLFTVVPGERAPWEKGIQWKRPRAR